MLKKKLPLILGFISISIVLSVLLTACTQPKLPEDIVIGVAWPFSANNSLFNEGIDLAVKEINSSGGINGKELKLLKEDDSSEVVRGIAIAQSFSENKAVRAVIGHRNSFVSIPASAIYNQAGLVMLSPASTAPELTANQYRYIFRNIPSDDKIAGKLADYLAGRGYRRMVIYYSADSYGIGLANSFEEQAKLQGITIVDRFNYYSGSGDLKRLHSRWQAFGYDGIFIATSMPGGAQFIVDAGRAGITGPFVAGNALDSPELAKIGGKMAEGIIVGSVFNPDSEQLEVQKFIASFQGEYKKMPTAYAASGYDAVRLLAVAIENSEGQNRASVAEELRNLGKRPGVLGFHEFSKTGDDLGNLVVLKKLEQENFTFIGQ